MRVWEWDIPVDMKYIADPGMHSMPAVTRAPNQKYLACQSLDNKIVIYTCGDKFRPHKKKAFKGHMVAGYACSPGMDTDAHLFLCWLSLSKIAILGILGKSILCIQRHKGISTFHRKIEPHAKICYTSCRTNP